MTVSDLMDFFEKEQKNAYSAAECHQLIEAFEPMRDRTSLSIEGKMKPGENPTVFTVQLF